MWHLEWDDKTAASNERKHHVSFEEAQTVFLDEDGLLIADPDAPGDEHRFVLLGVSSRLRLLVVCHTYREEDEVIRIISARRGNRRERRLYGERLG